MINEVSIVEKKVDIDDKRFSSDMNQYMIELSQKSFGIFQGLLDKTAKLQDKEKFQKEIDEFSLKVADTAWKQAHKHQDRVLKERQVNKEEVSMFHQLMKDANSGNLNEIEINSQTDIPRNSSDKSTNKG